MTRIAGWGHAVPPVLVTSRELEQRLSLPAGWIEQRYGVDNRRMAGPEQATSDLAVEAVEMMFQSIARPETPGLLILATSTPDHPLPPTAPLVAERVGLKNWGAIDLAGACSGFIYALSFGNQHCQAFNQPVIVVAANVLSRRVDTTDPATSTIFADGAGAVLLTPGRSDCLKSVSFNSDGSRYDTIRVNSGGSRQPITDTPLTVADRLMRMERGPELFRAAVHAMTEVGQQVLQQHGGEIDWWIPHQANLRLIREVGKRLKIQESQTLLTLPDWGNSSAASIPLTLSIAASTGQFQTGDKLLLTAAGAGMISAGAILEW